MKNKAIIIISSFLILIIFSCNHDKKKTADNTSQPVKPKVIIPVFNADTAYKFVAKQVSFGSRVPNSKAHDKCADYIINILKDYTKNVTIQEYVATAFDGTRLKGKNIIVSFNPDTNNRIFIASHWDSRPFADYDPDEKMHKTPIPGANDGGSGVGILMELTRLLSAKNPPIGVDFILFDVEDYGAPSWAKSDNEDSYCLGSQYWSNNPHKPGYNAKYGILLDMVGAPNPTFSMEATSMYYAPDIMRNVWETAKRIGYAKYFVTDQTSGLIDDHLYINKIKRIPTIDIVHHDNTTKTGFYPFWHTMKDDMTNIDKNTLTLVANLLLTVIYEEN